MKKLLLMALVACACHASAQNYSIEGTAPGLDGQKVYIGEGESLKRLVMVDSAVVENGTFRMEKPLKAVRQAYLLVGDAKQMFLLDEVPLKATYTTQTKTVAGKEVASHGVKLEGDPDQELLSAMNGAVAQEMFSMLAISFMSKGRGDVNAPENKGLADSIATLYTTAKANTKRVLDSIVDNFHDSYVSAIILRDFFSKELPVKELQSRYAALSDRVKKSNIGADVQSLLKSMAAISVGQVAPDFTLNAPDGKPVSLSSLRGKCVLIDFWASWCGPCLREAPNVKRVYDKYHDKGFEVLSVSLDDKKDAWVKAIEKHQLNWLHVSSLKGWGCPVAKLYNVTGIPAMFLLDKDGKIVSTNARGEALEQEVSKLCK